MWNFVCMDNFAVFLNSQFVRKTEVKFSAYEIFEENIAYKVFFFIIYFMSAFCVLFVK